MSHTGDNTHVRSTPLIDKLPAWLRHLLIIVATAGLGVLVQVPYSGWDSDLRSHAIDAAVGAGITFLLLLLTPLTSQYGVGKSTPDVPIG